MTHSPGPWKFDGDWRRLPTIFDANKVKIALIEKDAADRDGWVHDIPEREANARLIAAAPDMLAALHEILTALQHRENHGPDSIDLSGFLVGIPHLIEKATGQRLTSAQPRDA